MRAEKFTRKLAKATAGAMFDEQTEDVWPKAKGSRVARPREALPMRFGSCEWGTRS